LITSVVAPIFRLYELVALDKSDDHGGLTLLRTIVGIISDAVLCSTLLLAANGSCILQDDPSFSEIIRSAVSSSAFVAFAISISDSDFQGWFLLVLMILCVASVGLFVVDMVASINQASLYILAHRIALRTVGSVSLAMSRKHNMYSYFQHSIMAAGVLAVLRHIMSSIMRLDFRIDELTGELLRSGTYGALAVLFRLRGSESDEHTEIADSTVDIEAASVSVGEGVRWQRAVMRSSSAEQIELLTIGSPDRITSVMPFAEERVDG
jgi:hypothetical protein